MDVLKNTKTSLLSKYVSKFLYLVVLMAITIVCFWQMSPGRPVVLDRQNLLLATVKQGDLEVKVEGFGSLISEKQQLITSYSRATVKEIMLKPGAVVSEGSVIVKLENLELEQQLESAQRELVQAQANLRQLSLNNKREKLNETANLAEIMASLSLAALRKAAEEKLVEDGVVSLLTFQQSALNAKQLEERVLLLKQRIAQLDLVHKESVNIQQERVKQQQDRVIIAEKRVARLTVKAGFNGVLQRLSVELGQSVSAGQEIALIGSVNSLIALIRIPQNQAQLITEGKQAIVDTRRDKINGVVSRISPIVEGNTVEIEIALPTNLPASARPQQSVDGVIIVDTLVNVMYITRPAGAQPHTNVQLFKLVPDLSLAQKHNLRFGVKAGHFVQVVSGARAGEQFVVSDLSNYRNINDMFVIH